MWHSLVNMGSVKVFIWAQIKIVKIFIYLFIQFLGYPTPDNSGQLHKVKRTVILFKKNNSIHKTIVWGNKPSFHIFLQLYNTCVPLTNQYPCRGEMSLAWFLPEKFLSSVDLALINGNWVIQSWSHICANQKEVWKLDLSGKLLWKLLKILASFGF